MGRPGGAAGGGEVRLQGFQATLLWCSCVFAKPANGGARDAAAGERRSSVAASHPQGTAIHAFQRGGAGQRGGGLTGSPEQPSRPGSPFRRAGGSRTTRASAASRSIRSPPGMRSRRKYRWRSSCTHGRRLGGSGLGVRGLRTDTPARRALLSSFPAPQHKQPRPRPPTWKDAYWRMQKGLASARPTACSQYTWSAHEATPVLSMRFRAKLRPDPGSAGAGKEGAHVCGMRAGLGELLG